MTLRAWLPRPPDDSLLAVLRAHLAPDVHLAVGKAMDSRHPPSVLIDGTPSERRLAMSPALDALVIPYAGLPAATRELLLRNERLRAFNLHHNAAPTAELAVALLLAAAKRLVPLDRELRMGRWAAGEASSHARTLEGLSALVLGYGTIGRRVARALLALGMVVRVVARRARTQDGVEVEGPDALRGRLREADALLVCLPGTPETEGIIGPGELDLLPAGAILVNVGRGPVVSEEALYRALERGHLGAAGLDVWYRYPKARTGRRRTLPSSFPFHELDNVVLSPHRGGHTRENETERMRALAALLNALADGDAEANRVDPERGY